MLLPVVHFFRPLALVVFGLPDSPGSGQPIPRPQGEEPPRRSQVIDSKPSFKGERSQVKVKKREFPREVPKRDFPISRETSQAKESLEARLAMRHFPSGRFQAKDSRRKILSQSFRAEDPMRMPPREVSQEKDPRQKNPSGSCQTKFPN